MTIRHGLLLVLAAAALDRVGGLSSSSSPSTSRRAPGPPRHLFVLVHGLAGTPSDLDYLRRRLEATGGGGGEDGAVEVLSVRSNEGRTFDGIQAGAARVASEVLERVAARSRADEGRLSLQRISFVGNSLGGLYARAALALLFRADDACEDDTRPPASFAATAGAAPLAAG